MHINIIELTPTCLLCDFKLFRTASLPSICIQDISYYFVLKCTCHKVWKLVIYVYLYMISNLAFSWWFKQIFGTTFCYWCYCVSNVQSDHWWTSIYTSLSAVDEMQNLVDTHIIKMLGNNIRLFWPGASHIVLVLAMYIGGILITSAQSCETPFSNQSHWLRDESRHLLYIVQSDWRLLINNRRGQYSIGFNRYWSVCEVLGISPVLCFDAYTLDVHLHIVFFFHFLRSV